MSVTCFLLTTLLDMAIDVPLALSPHASSSLCFIFEESVDRRLALCTLTPNTVSS